ncbi:hypothetical protein [Bacillus suaedae]|uniref:Nucleic acid-binding protein n=1 Tax=Halalkalibacter suaedae TaxID=2822140 RepID=A0A940WS22_9BACI|nr:hypothetical protein [Bacillus suaedae]MBP3951664.1 hypothetical protein [Bacillus suaedae]
MTINHEKSCVKCGSDMIECYVDQGLKGLLVKNPSGEQLFKNKKNTRMNPFVCIKCGYAEWYADTPEDLI